MVGLRGWPCLPLGRITSALFVLYMLSTFVFRAMYQNAFSCSCLQTLRYVLTFPLNALRDCTDFLKQRKAICAMNSYFNFVPFHLAFIILNCYYSIHYCLDDDDDEDSNSISIYIILTMGPIPPYLLNLYFYSLYSHMY